MKKVVFLMLAVALIASPVFAAETMNVSERTTDTSVDTSFIKKIIQWVVGIAGGVVVLVKGSTGIITAIKNQQDDHNGIMKAVGQVVFNIVVLVLIEVFIAYAGKLIGGWLGNIFGGETVSWS